MKNSKLASKYHVKATECFSKKQYAESLENYNQLLRFAVKDSQLLSDAFAGRAQVYFNVEKYQLCSDNIQRAIAACVNSEKCESFKSIQAECNQILKEIPFKSDEAKSSFKLSHAAHKKVPFIAECLEVLENEVYGRYIATTRDLKAGDVVVLEEPFYKVLDPEQRHTRCAVCLKQNMLNLFPCGKCSKGEC
jgi:SET and MYND domain-containing protein 4